MGDPVLKKFGRYFLLDRIARGGMAEIYRARLSQSDGAGRLLVIKRILGTHGNNKEFKEMFKSEIKVTMGFNHPNVVQVYDFGEEQDQPYIAMEFVDGKTLRQIIGRFTKEGKTMPPDLAAWLIAQAAMGLHYAHSYKDKISGRPLQIIHRDVSPQNILVSFDGSVKVIDFGIAKATTNGEQTRVGIIKGKPSYLSPEQVAGETLDPRSDIFSLGIVLWECLTGKKLFAAPSGENEFAVLKLIESCETYVKPPSKLVEEVPRELDYLVLRALAKQKEKRFQSAEEFSKALNKFIYSFNPEFDTSEATQMIRTLFRDDIVQDRKELQSYNEKAEQLLAQDISGVLELDHSQSQKDASETTTMMKKPPGAPGTSVGKTLDSKSVSSQKLEIQSQSGIQIPKRNNGPTPVWKKAELSSVSEKKGRAIQFTFKKQIFWIAATVAAVIFLGPDAKKMALEQFSLWKKSREVVTEKQPEKSSPSSVALQNEKSILLRLQISSGLGEETQIHVNGTSVNESKPEIVAPLDAPIELVVERPKFRKFRREFVIPSEEAQGRRVYTVQVDLEPVQFGFLSIYSTPSAQAQVISIDAENRQLASETRGLILKTPIENVKVPEGTYRVKLENKLLGMEKSEIIKVDSGKSVKMNVRLEVSP